MDADRISRKFANVSRGASRVLGTWQAFCLAVLLILVWLCCGFWVGFLDPTYQLIINTLTTIVTFLMGFLILSSQNRDTASFHLKLDALIHGTNAANEAARSEDLTDKELAALKQRDAASR